MSSNLDFRVSCGLFDHEKWMRLEAAGGERSGLALLKLWAWARQHRPNGDLSGLSDRELAAAARWRGRPAQLLEVLVGAGWVDRVGESLHLHDWGDWQGWSCGSPAREFAARIAAMTKQCLRVGLTPDAYLDQQAGAVAKDQEVRAALRAAHAKAQARKGAGEDRPKSKGRYADGGETVRGESAAECAAHAPRSAPSPSPSPTPSPNGGGMGAAARPTAPAGSVAPPPGGGPEAPPQEPRCPRCRDTRQVTRHVPLGAVAGPGGPRRPLFVPCPKCSAGPTEARPEEAERGYAVAPAVVPCSPRRPARAVVAAPRARIDWGDDEA